MKTFAGIGQYLDTACPDAWLRNTAGDDPVLNEMGNIIAQAYENPAAAAGIIAEAKKRLDVVNVRARVGREVMDAARRDLLPKGV
jgi:hypothetical protein